MEATKEQEAWMQGYSVGKGEREEGPKPLIRFEVMLRNLDGDRWTMMWSAENFAHAESLTLLQLGRNGDTHSFIHRIELW
jgi:hypothetical protein